MSVHLPPLNALRAFEAAARHLSFKRAAEELSVTPTAISHQIRGLEGHLGVSLFHRLPRALELTAEGEAMLPKLREGMDCFKSAVAAVRSLGPARRLAVVAPPSFASHWLLPRLQAFSSQHPHIELLLSGSLRTIDGSTLGAGVGEDRHASADMPEIWVRYGTGKYPGHRVELLFTPDFTPMCSPALLRAKLPLREPAHLRYHTLIHDHTIQNVRERPSWAEWLRLAGVSGVNAAAGPYFAHSGLAITAALDGLGVALLSRPLVSSEVAAGRLVAPFERSITHHYAYYLVTPETVADRPEVAAFRAWMLEQAAASVCPAAPA